MIVPQFWAEGRAQHKEPGRQVTVRRFGWSDLSEEDAQANANDRANEALQRVLAGDNLARREPKVSYNGADGVPIREEIVSRHGDAVITRNSYGALCLNTPDVLFVDVDFTRLPPTRLTFTLGVILFAMSMAFAINERHFGLFVLGCVLSAVGSLLLSAWLFRGYELLAGGSSRRAMRRIRSFSARNPGWNLCVYETPAGFRVLMMHDVFDPSATQVADCFRQLGADPVYARMCLRQHCFRARISPKPWRIGLSSPLRPRPGVWPVKAEHLPKRLQWIHLYEEKSAAFASCRHVGQFGSSVTHPAAEAVRKIHDEMSRAFSGLPLA
ncbi:hypothetical protein [Prosthecobacter sp.]|uniref:hypothetical protein n=1 Tax=Prosthecobacter sp. TaxID=1965333 RepID=UPI001E122922|nr:hypothetical protein [Prosthecobacter sp.]MCB1276037.1 hypothetical protein [Prosthecobacter sp.]